MKSGIILIALLLTIRPAHAADVDAEYLKLVDAAMANPASGQWCDIRARYPDTSFYRAHLGVHIKQQTMEAGEKMLMEKTRESVDAFRDFMRRNAASVGAHYYAAYLYKWNNDLTREKVDALLPDFGNGVDYIDPAYENAAAQGLIGCILKTGDGRTEATAYHVVTIDEAEVMIDKYYKVDAVGLQNVKANGHMFDVVTIQIPDSRTQEKLYFQLDDRLVRGAIAAELAAKLKPALAKKSP